MIDDDFIEDGEGIWFIYDDDFVGPYATKKEANEDRRGLARFDKYKDHPDFIPCDSKVKA